MEKRTGIGTTRAVTPSTSPMLAMLEPRALPVARSGMPSSEAISETTISGAEVPRATMVMPTSIVLMPARRAVAAAAPTKWSALHSRATRPRATAISGSSMASLDSSMGGGKGRH